MTIDISFSRYFIFAVLVFILCFSAATHSTELQSSEVTTLSQQSVFGTSEERQVALEKLSKNGDKSVIATLILALRYKGALPEILAALQKITGEKNISSWADAMLWQEAHGDIKPHSSYRDIKLEIFSRIDPAFLRFLGGDKSKPGNMRIRLEEITWGGVGVDGIPSLDNPKMLKANEATYLKDTDLVFGISIKGDARAYPLRIMGWHEMFNDTIGGVPVALAYCTLCGSGILFDTHINDRHKPFVFGSSGFLYRSNKLMFDRETDSLWNQFTGEPVTGPLVGKGIKLKIRPVTITTWKHWQAHNPDTKVLSLKTGFHRDYGSGVVYKDYFSSPDLMFPTIVRDETRIKRKDYVYGIREFGAARAWPLDAFEKSSVINDKIGEKNIVLIGDATSRSVRAYERGDIIFKAGTSSVSLKGSNETWLIKEDHLESPKGIKLPRIAGHISYWFAWDGYMHAQSSLYTN